MTKKILLLNDKDESLLRISFTLRHAQYSSLLFHDPEELVNWARIYEGLFYDRLLLIGCCNAAELEKLQRLLHSSELDLKILIVGSNLPQKIKDMAENSSQLSFCKQEDLIAELKKFQPLESTVDKNNR